MHICRSTRGIIGSCYVGDEEGERRMDTPGKEKEAAIGLIVIDTRLNRFKPIFDSA